MKTMHFIKRQQQRGIPEQVIEWLLLFGDEVHDHHGCVIYHFSRVGRKRMEREIGSKIVRQMNERLNSYLVVSNDGAFVTVGKCLKRIRH